MSVSINFDRASTFYDATRGFPHGIDQHVARFIQSVADLNTHHTILEIGIGTGRISFPLAPHVHRIIGVDISTLMMHKLREKQNGEAIYLAQADAHRLPFADMTFDAVVIVHVLHLVAEPVTVLKELGRVIKPGGKLIHGRNKHHHNAVQVLVDAWQRDQISASNCWNNIDDYMIEAGWSPIADEQEFPFTVTISPQQYLELIENRSMSSLWNMSDEDHARAITAIRQAIAEHFPNREHMPLEGSASFGVRLWSL